MSHYKPAGHNAVSPYLLPRDVKAMIEFLSAAFGAEEIDRTEAADGSIRHAEVRIDDSVLMMGERPAGQQIVACSTHVYVPDVDACYASALQAGATGISQPRDQPYGDRSAGVRDAEGNIWWLGTHLGKDEPPA